MTQKKEFLIDLGDFSNNNEKILESVAQFLLTPSLKTLKITGDKNKAEVFKKILEATVKFQDSLYDAKTNLSVISENLEAKSIISRDFEKEFGVKWSF